MEKNKNKNKKVIFKNKRNNKVTIFNNKYIIGYTKNKITTK